MKREVMRLYTMSDAGLVLKGNQTISFARRDKDDFTDYGIDPTSVYALETQIAAFAESLTDIELRSDQTAGSQIKDGNAEVLRQSIREVMKRVETKFGPSSAKYKKFGTTDLSHQTDAELVITGKRVARVGAQYLEELAPNGLKGEMLDGVAAAASTFSTSIIDKGLLEADRDIEQEDRVEAGNAIYAQLVHLARTGQNIWEDKDAAKCNDYVLYDQPDGGADTAPSNLSTL